jgi:hypothetical protein
MQPVSRSNGSSSKHGGDSGGSGGNVVGAMIQGGRRHPDQPLLRSWYSLAKRPAPFQPPHPSFDSELQQPDNGPSGDEKDGVRQPRSRTTSLAQRYDMHHALGGLLKRAKRGSTKESPIDQNNTIAAIVQSPDLVDQDTHTRVFTRSKVLTVTISPPLIPNAPRPRVSESSYQLLASPSLSILAQSELPKPLSHGFVTSSPTSLTGGKDLAIGATINTTGTTSAGTPQTIGDNLCSNDIEEYHSRTRCLRVSFSILARHTTLM